jgi:PKD repeat protein
MEFYNLSSASAIFSNFSATPITGQAPLTVIFTNTSINIYSNSSWDFGDGSTSNASNPTHTYHLAGTNSVSLTVSNTTGEDTETKPSYIIITAPGGEEITPEDEGEISFESPGGGTITIQVPIGAIAETIILQATENSTVNVPLGSGLVGTSFNLTALLECLPVENYEFLTPITIRVDYTNEQVEGLAEDSLHLYFWDEEGETWTDAAQTCDPGSAYNRNPEEN